MVPGKLDAVLGIASQTFLSPVLQKLSSQVKDFDPNGNLLPHQLFPSEIISQTSVTAWLFSPLTSFLYWLGDAVAITWGIYYLILIGSRLFNGFYNLRQYILAYGFSKHALYAFCPEIHTSRKMRISKQQKEQKAKTNEDHIYRCVSSAMANYHMKSLSKMKQDEVVTEQPAAPTPLYPKVHKNGMPLSDQTWLDTHKAAAPRQTTNTYSTFTRVPGNTSRQDNYDHVNGKSTTTSESDTLPLPMPLITRPNTPPPPRPT